MKRDMEVIRKLILALEAAEFGVSSDEIDLGIDNAVVEYHMRLMAQANLITVDTLRCGIMFKEMTWAGHDFADTCRDDTVWRRTTKEVKEKSKSVSFDVLLALLKAAATKLLIE